MDGESEAAYAEFVGTHWRSMVRAAVFLGASPHEAEDLSQTALLRCYTAWAKVTAADDREAYVYRILLNCLRDARRSRWWKGRVDHEVDHEESSQVADSSEAIAVADAVHRALAGLSKPNREVVVLRYFVQLTEAQTAATLGISPGTVKSRLSRSLARLAADRHLIDLSGRTS